MPTSLDAHPVRLAFETGKLHYLPCKGDSKCPVTVLTLYRRLTRLATQSVAVILGHHAHCGRSRRSHATRPTGSQRGSTLLIAELHLHPGSLLAARCSAEAEKSSIDGCSVRYCPRDIVKLSLVFSMVLGRCERAGQPIELSQQQYR